MKRDGHEGTWFMTFLKVAFKFQIISKRKCFETVLKHVRSDIIWQVNVDCTLVMRTVHSYFSIGKLSNSSPSINLQKYVLHGQRSYFPKPPALNFYCTVIRLKGNGTVCAALNYRKYIMVHIYSLYQSPVHLKTPTPTLVPCTSYWTPLTQVYRDIRAFVVKWFKKKD